MPPFDVETRVALVERDISQMTGFFGRLDSTMEKLTDVSAAIKELLAVHEVKLQRNEESTGQVFKILDQHRTEAKDQEHKISESIKQTKDDIKEEMSKLEERLVSEIGAIKTAQTDFYKGIGKRVGSLESWKWQAAGVILIVGFIFTQFAGFVSNYFANVFANLLK